MYVKVTYADAANSDFLIEAVSPLHWGKRHVPYTVPNPVPGPDIATGLEVGLGAEHFPNDSDTGEYQRMPFAMCHVLHIDDTRRTQYELKNDLLVVNYVWWDQPMEGLVCVATTRPIYILGDNGKTIDRV